MFDEGRNNIFNPDDFEEDEEFFFSDGNDNENSDEYTGKEDDEGHTFMFEDEQPEFDDFTKSGFQRKADQVITMNQVKTHLHIVMVQKKRQQRTRMMLRMKDVKSVLIWEQQIL